jgi:hypothetical protein
MPCTVNELGCCNVPHDVSPKALVTLNEATPIFTDFALTVASDRQIVSDAGDLAARLAGGR